MAPEHDVAVIILSNEEGEILLQKKTMNYPWFPGKWCLFGGAIEKNETPKEAIVRELNEELGTRAANQVENISFIVSEKYEDNRARGMIRGKMHFYHGTFKGNISTIQITEGAGFAFFSPEELDTLNMVERTRKALASFLSRTLG